MAHGSSRGAGSTGIELVTPRLRLRELSRRDAALMLDLATDPDWIRFIGDKGVRSLEDAEDYLVNALIPRYRENGYLLCRIDRKAGGVPLGIAGLLQREDLEDADVGFALLARHRGHGYAQEAAAALVDHGRRVLGLRRIAALTVPENLPSIRVLERLGFRFQRRLRLAGSREPMDLYACEGSRGE